MERIATTPRPDWQDKVEESGVLWHTRDGIPYWNESVRYVLSPSDRQAIKTATEHAYLMCLEATDHVVENNLLHVFGIADKYHAKIKESWQGENTCFLDLGAFDFAYTPGGTIKLLEYNSIGSVPIVEVLAAQPVLVREQHREALSFENLNNGLARAFTAMVNLHGPDQPIHILVESLMTPEQGIVAGFIERAIRAYGFIHVKVVGVADVGWDSTIKQFTDPSGNPMELICNLCDWLTLLDSSIGEYLNEVENTVFTNPLWKVLWESKGMLLALYDKLPKHPLILEAARTLPEEVISYVKKPLLGHHGENIQVVKDKVTLAKTSGEFSDGAFIYQELVLLVEMDGKFPIVSGWSIYGEFWDISIREGGLITNNHAQFVPCITTR